MKSYRVLEMYKNVDYGPYVLEGTFLFMERQDYCFSVVSAHSKTIHEVFERVVGKEVVL